MRQAVGLHRRSWNGLLRGSLMHAWGRSDSLLPHLYRAVTGKPLGF